MHCREARHRLTVLGAEEARMDRELQEHLADCPDCAQVVRAELTLGRVLEAAAEDDASEMAPMARQRLAVEARASARGPLAHTWAALNALLQGPTGRRPRYAATAAIVVAVIATVGLVPFTYYQTVGYDVALAGLDREVALDDDLVCEMLDSLGLVEAAVDVTGCEETCNLLVFDLKNEEEARLVVSALDELCQNGCTAAMHPVLAQASGSLLDQANQKILSGSSGG